jgi:hypothetical protein
MCFLVFLADAAIEPPMPALFKRGFVRGFVRVMAAPSICRDFERSPLGMEGASIRGGWGPGFLATPYFIQRRQRMAGVKDACKLAR